MSFFSLTLLLELATMTKHCTVRSLRTSAVHFPRLGVTWWAGGVQITVLFDHLLGHQLNLLSEWPGHAKSNMRGL